MENVFFWISLAILVQFPYGLTDQTSLPSFKNKLFTLPLDPKIAVDRCHPVWGPSCSVENASCRPAGYSSSGSPFSSTVSYACFCSSPAFRPAIRGETALDESYGPAAVKCLPTAFVPQYMASCREDTDCALIPHSKCGFNLQSFSNICTCDKANGYDIVPIDTDPEEITQRSLYRCTKKPPQLTTATVAIPTTTAVLAPSTTPLTNQECGQFDGHCRCQSGYTMLNGYCAANYGTECLTSDCTPDTNFYCWVSNKKAGPDLPRCFCRPYHMPERALLLGGHITGCKASFGEPCWNYWDCGRPAMLCFKHANQARGICLCIAGQEWDSARKACVSPQTRYAVMRYFRVHPSLSELRK